MISKKIFIPVILFLFPVVITDAYAKSGPGSKVGVIATRNSPFTKLHDVPVSAVTLNDGFWKKRLIANYEHSIPQLLRLLEEHGVVDNFRRLSGRKNVERRGYLFTDSDLFKWMEAAAFVLQSRKDPELMQTLEAIIDDVLAAQDEDGYLNTYHTKDKRFSNFRNNHELYCLGHLIQAAIAHYRGSGERRLLDGAIRYADLIVNLFGRDKKQCFPGHPEIEMAMVELYRTTGEKRYLDFVDYLLNDIKIDEIEEPVTASTLEYTFAGIPFKTRKELRSHAVRAMYACCGATDFYMEKNDPEIRQALETLWHDMTQYKMYVSGGVGSRYRGEAFGNIYELPNERAYTETCAAIGSIMWNWRLLNTTADARFANIMERALYNGFLSGVALNGTDYFYRNPLLNYGDAERQPWYDCTCCPPNVERTLASLPGYFYSTSAKGIWLHLYDNNRLVWQLEDGTPLVLTQTTKYPWDNNIEITVQPAKENSFSVFLRIPDWTEKAEVTVNGLAVKEDVVPGTYFQLKRMWAKNDKIEFTVDMPASAVYANPRLRMDAGAVAFQRGPVVYCLEGVDHPGFSIFDVTLPLNADDIQDAFYPEWHPDLLGGVVTIGTRAKLYEPSLLESPLYWPHKFAEPAKQVDIVAVPYYAWANRGRTEMQVWFPYFEAEKP